MLWQLAIGPAVACGVVLALWQWRRTAVRLDGTTLSKPKLLGSTKAAQPSPSPNDSSSDPVKGKAAAEGGATNQQQQRASIDPDAEYRSVEESANWIRRVMGMPVVRDALAHILEKTARSKLQSVLHRLQDSSRGWITHADVACEVTTVIVDVNPSPCDEDDTAEEWVDVDAAMLCTGALTVSVDLNVLRSLTVSTSLTLSKFRVAGAVARCHTAGDLAGHMQLLRTPDMSMELRTSVGHPAAPLSICDCGFFPLLLETVARRQLARLVGRVFVDALTSAVEAALPESLLNAEGGSNHSTASQGSPRAAALP